MLALGPLAAVGVGELHAGEAVGALEQLFDGRLHSRAPGSAIENGMKLGVEGAPAARVPGPELITIFGENVIELGIVGRGEKGCRLLEQSRLEQRPELEQFLDLFRREAGNDGSLMRLHLHQAFGLEQDQSLAEGDTADAQLLGQDRLPQLHAGRILALEDAAAQFIGGGRSARRRHDHSLGGKSGHDSTV